MWTHIKHMSCHGTNPSSSVPILLRSLDSIIALNYAFFSFIPDPSKRWLKKQKREWFFQYLPLLPHSFTNGIKMNNKNNPLHPALSSISTSINADFICTSQNKRLRHFFIIWNNKNGVWGKQGIEKKRLRLFFQSNGHVMPQSSRSSLFPPSQPLQSRFLFAKMWHRGFFL